MSSSCPLCHLNVSLDELEWHVNNHFEEDELARDMELAHQIALAPPSPTYMHSGHSRTIVGIQMKKGVRGMPDVYNLLVLDPGQSTEALERSLREKNGWQQLIKRGVHTLKNLQYQLCYVDTGIAYGAEIERLKILDSVLIKI